MNRHLPQIASLFLFLFSGLCVTAQQKSFFVYVGTYGTGVHGYRFQPDAGTLAPMGQVGALANPSFLTTDPAHKFLYAASELNGNVNGNAGSFSIDGTTGKLKLLNTRSAEGQAPCYVSTDLTGKMVFVANYGTGEVVVFPIESNGSLGPLSQTMSAHGSSINKERQEGPHAHEAVPSRDNRFLYVPDLGLDEIRIYRIDATAKKLSVNNPPFAKLSPGNGPRHIALTSDGRYAYVINELKPVVTVFSRDPKTGALTQIQELSSLPQGFKGEDAPAEILLDASNTHVYASNRGPGTIAVFARDPKTGMLTQIQIAATGGTEPRGVAMDPTGRFLFTGDQKANNFVLFRIDPSSGKLTLTGQSYKVSSPVSFVFVPVG